MTERLGRTAKGIVLSALIFLPFRGFAADMDMVVVSSGDTVNFPMTISNQPKSQGLLHPQYSVIAPEFLVLTSTTSKELGPTEIPIGSSWTTSIAFFVSTSAPIGCTAIAYNLGFASGEFVPDNIPLHFKKIFIAPSPLPRSMRELKRAQAACSKGPAKVDWNWRWKNGRPGWLPEEYMPTRDVPLLADPNTRSPSSLPRGEFGFALGATLAQVDANASKRGLEWDPVSNRSMTYRLFKVLRDPEVQSISMFLMDGPVNIININYGTRERPLSFEVVREKLRRKLGKERDSDDFIIDAPENRQRSAIHEHYQFAYWWDCRTLIRLWGSTLEFIDLKPGGRISSGIIGRSGPRRSFSGCESE